MKSSHLPKNRPAGMPLFLLALTLIVSLLLGGSHGAQAQIMPLTLEPDGGNRKASVSEQLGIVKIDIRYSRPGVKGREGHIYGTPVAHYGFQDLGHGTGNAVPWRAGANENTTISFSHPVRVNGRDLNAGTYGFFICLGAEKDTLIFSRVSNSWGSFYYDAAFDALRVPVTHEILENGTEWLQYAFEKQTDTSVGIALSWEHRKFPFTISADTKKLQLQAFTEDFRTTRPYYDFLNAVYWCVRNDYGLEQALAWADRAIYFRVMGEKNFRTLQGKAMVLFKLGRSPEALELMQEAMPMGQMEEVHYYGRQLIGMGMTAEALSVFRSNLKRHPDRVYTLVGMARAYSALGEFTKAAGYLEKALPLSETDFERADLNQKLAGLRAGTDINL